MTADHLIPMLGWTLLNFLWQGALLGLLSAGLLRACRQARPQLRYALLALALLVALLLPVVDLWLLQGSGPENPTDALTPDDAPVWLATLQDLLPTVVAAWLAGVTLMGGRLALGLLWVGRLRREADATETQGLTPRLQALAQALGLPRWQRERLQLRAHPALRSPVTAGWWRPVVILPAGLLSRMPMDAIEALLAHELAHVKRWDYLAHLLQSVVEALLFFHPVVWWLSRRLREERELVADALAARATADPRALARALHALSGTARQPAMAPAAHHGDLAERIRRLLGRAPAPGVRRSALPLALLFGALLCLAAQLEPAEAASGGTHAGGTVTQEAPAPQAPAPAPAPTAAASASSASPGLLPRLPISSNHVLVMDSATGQVLMSKNADEVVPIASLTKLMTAMVLLDARQDMNERLRIDAEDVDRLKHSASHLPVGAQLARGDALKLALMSSENRAAHALARNYPGGLEAFDKAMQAKIRTLGLKQTVIEEPTGLSPRNASTATEVARIAEAASRYADITRITSDAKDKVAINGRQVEARNTNRLVGRKGWDILLSKTGYTTEAGRCLTMQLRDAGKKLTVVLLDAGASAERLRDAQLIRRSIDKLH